MNVIPARHVIEGFNALPLDEKEYVLDLLRKTYVEHKRTQLEKRLAKADSDLRKGLVKRGTVEDLRKDLEND